jgi:phosphatidate phosphatase APP1
MTSLLDAMTRRRPRPLSNLAREDRVVLFPSVGYLSRDRGHWIANVHGDISCAGKLSLGKRVLLKLFKRAMRASDEEVASPLFHERIDRFVAQDRRGVRVAVKIGDQIYGLPKKSRPNGQFQAAVRIPVDQIRPESESRCAEEKCLSVEVCGARASGRVHLLEPTGLSVISDIDDTLKHSDVACKRTLLTNTFLRPFEAIPGMAPLFREWSAEGAAFHYVSSSPWQLYEHLAEHLASEGFPAGSFHLRPFRLRDHLLRRILMLRRSGKLSVIRTLMRTFPQRRFLLVGDSGEHDPEIYGVLARRYPQQVAGVFIRQLDCPNSASRRYARAFRGVDPGLLRIYREAVELADVKVGS